MLSCFCSLQINPINKDLCWWPFHGTLKTQSSFSPKVTPDSENDFGNYNCTAVNRIGQESLEFILVQAGKHPLWPHYPYPCRPVPWPLMTPGE